MLRDLSALLVVVLAGGVTAASCNGSCDDCSSSDSSSGSGCGTACGGCTSCGGCTATSTQTSCGDCGCGGGVSCLPSDPNACSLLSPSSPDGACVSGHQKCKGSEFSQCDEVLHHPDGCAPPVTWTCAGDPPPCGGATWATALPGTGKETARSIAVDGSGNVVIAGVSSGGALHVHGQDVDDGGAFVAKLDAMGTPLWAKALDGATTAFVSTDATGAIYVTGAVLLELKIDGHHLHARDAAPPGGGDANTGYLVKLGPAGQWVWGKLLHGTKSLDPGAITTAPQGVLVAGSYVGSGHFDQKSIEKAQGSDAFVASFDPTTGAAKWANRLGTSQDETVVALAVGDDASIYVGGWITDRSIAGKGQCDPDRALLASLLPDGAVSWSHVQEKRPVRIAALAISGHDVVAVGQVHSTFNGDAGSFPVGGYVGVYNSANGNERWSRPTSWDGTAVAFDSNHLVVVAGAAASGEAFAMKIDVHGQLYYEHAYSPTPLPGEGTSSIGIFGIAAGANGSAFVAGGLRGSASLGLGFDGHTVSSTTKTDIFVARLDP